MVIDLFVLQKYIKKRRKRIKEGENKYIKNWFLNETIEIRDFFRSNLYIII